MKYEEALQSVLTYCSEECDKIDTCRSEYKEGVEATVIKALEKQIPKKPHISKEEYAIHYKCPVCGCRFISKIDGEYVAGNKYIYCYICGQAIDWNVIEENGAE